MSHIEILKQQLHISIDMTEDENLLLQIIDMLNPPTLTQEELANIERGRAQIAEGKGIPAAVVLKKIKDKIDQANAQSA